MTATEKRQGESCTGLAVCFRTDSRTIGVRVTYSLASEANGNSSAIKAARSRLGRKSVSLQLRGGSAICGGPAPE